MTGAMSRRRFIRISGAAAGLALAPLGRAAASNRDVVVWRGTMLGAVATMQIHHDDRSEAERLISVACAEARRLERLFSLYRDDSALVELNRTGVLVDPAADMVELLSISQHYAELTGGLFDVTVQPLWELYAGHFSREDADPAGPPQTVIQAALARVGSGRLAVRRDRIAMPRGMAVTLNGIAQGYVTDKVVDLLRAHGIAHSLVDMGETRAIGSHPDGRAWEVGITDPELPGRMQCVLPVVDRALSTSGGYGFQFGPQGRFNHLFDPASGACGHLYRSVTAVAATATAADALSTAFSLMDQKRIQALMSVAGIERVHLIEAAGTSVDLIA
ncbi:FAD:protein FMN transferase [Bradyrhizobium xenonodulans]|uniref:FAD:protein FMN transferase n=1 Tax=Bradyrhizobium xenonodulans TaxID=2736875 RepID=A0ABY7MWT9_9BRAD|nr:FAD:protein FMN transferase [Bradyrhizobium xenonodulans]WBL82029.1 FAD:protein FMN transferase [Bradyrhizobium xenonodulans]